MKTLKLRIKDKHCKVLDQLAAEVNFVWNYVNDLSFNHLQRTGSFSQHSIWLNTQKELQNCVVCIVKQWMQSGKNMLVKENSLKSKIKMACE